MSFEDMLMYFFPGYIAIEIFHLLKKRPFYDDTNIKSGIGREILYSVFYSAIIKFAISLLGLAKKKECLPEWLSIEQMTIIVSFGIGVAGALIVFVLSKFDWVTSLYKKIFRSNPSYSMWHDLLEHGAYVEFVTTRGGEKKNTIKGLVENYYVDSNGQCQIVIGRYIIRDENDNIIQKSDNPHYNRHLMFCSEDINVLEIMTVKRLKSKDRREKRKLLRYKWWENKLNMHKEIVGDKDAIGINVSIRRFVAGGLIWLENLIIRCYKTKIEKIQLSGWYVDEIKTEMIEKARAYCRKEGLSIDKFNQLETQYVNDELQFKKTNEIVLKVKKAKDEYVIYPENNIVGIIGKDATT